MSPGRHGAHRSRKRRTRLHDDAPPPVAEITLTGDADHYAALARALDRDLANGPTGRDPIDLDFLRDIRDEAWVQAGRLSDA